MGIIPSGLVQKFAKSILETKQESPHIFFAAGITGVVVGTYLACKATLTLEKSVDEIRNDIQDVKDLADPEHPHNAGMVYVEQEYYKDLGYVYVKSAIKVGKLYGPAILVGGVGIACLTGSHVQLSRRNAALTMTLAAVSKAFDEYRARVREELGEEKELDIHRAIRTESHQINGKKQLVKVTDPSGHSPYARLFDESNPNWIPNAEHNRVFLQAQENYHNHNLNARGFVFLNEVYNSLGYEYSQAGQIVGWVKDDNSDGDGYIDFGIYEAFENEYASTMEPRIWLDFNVDGPIHEKIKE